MQDRPEDLDLDELASLLVSQWQLPAGRLSYLRVGHGDHHWALADGAGRRWFVTVVDFDGGWRGTGRAAGLADLTAAMRTASALASHGLDFVLAPLPTAGGAQVASLDDRFAVTVFPYLHGQAGRYSDPGTPAGRLELVGMLAAVHGATAAVAHLAPRRDCGPASRAQLDAAMDQLGSPWPGGPRSEPCRALLAAHEPAIRRVLARFDQLVTEVTSAGRPALVTHGEPHAGNLFSSAGHTWLIDWDTVGLAPPERDLWRFGRPGCAEFTRYTELTGRAVHGAAIELYRLRWQLDDLALFTGEVRAGHEGSADAEVAWAAVNEIVEDFEGVLADAD